MNTWTYFVQSVDGGPIKIGFTSKDPNERLAALQVGSPTKLRIVGLLPSNCEKELHKRFADHRSHGEWFHASKDLLEFIATEASSHLQERLVTESRLELDATTVPVLAVSRQEVSASNFDIVFPNDEDLFFSWLDYIDWDEGERWDGEGELDDVDLVSNSITSMAIECELAGSFIESVGVNADAGFVGFICGPCDSAKRRTILKNLGCYAHEIDSITSRWFFFAVFWAGGKQVGIDLLRLAITPIGGPSHYIFDPVAMFSGQSRAYSAQTQTCQKT